MGGVRTEHIAEDNLGYLWFASWDNGASRFDGDRFELFTRSDGLCGDRVYAIHLDLHQRLWFATTSGVCWYDGEHFHSLNQDGIADRPVQYLYEDQQGRVWCGGTGTLGYFNGTEYRDLVPLYEQQYGQPPSPHWTNECWGIAQDLSGNIWFGFDYLVRFDDESFFRYDVEDGFPQDATCYVVGSDQAGTVWIGRAGDQQGLWRYANGTFCRESVELGGMLRKIQSDREGRVWFCTRHGALWYDGAGFDRFTTEDGLPYPVVNTMHQDREGQFWFGTWGGGVALYDADGLAVFGRGEDFPEGEAEISQIRQDRRGDIWIGFATPFLSLTSESICRFDGETFEFIGARQGLDLNSCFAIYVDGNDDLWFGGGNGLFRYAGETFERIGSDAGFGPVGVSAVAQDHAGRLVVAQWENGTTAKREELFASPLQIVRLQGDQFETLYREQEKGDPFNHIGALVATRDRELWFSLGTHNPSGRGKGVGRLHTDGGISLYSTDDGLADNRVTDLLEDRQGNLWIATQSGLSLFVDGVGFKNFTTEDGLPSNRLRCLFEDQRGHLWLGSDGGVAHYNGEMFQSIKSQHIGPVLRILEDQDGTFWFGTALGSVVRYRPRQIAPRVRILQVVADLVYENPQHVDLSTDARQVIFEYKGMSFTTHPRDMLYVCQLVGYESESRAPTRELRAYYRDLAPGEYTFQVRAIDRDLNTSSAARVRVTVGLDPRLEALTAALSSSDAPSSEFTGRSPALQQVHTRFVEVAPSDLTVLILGETGVGKGLAARALHQLSRRSQGPLIHVNCGAIPTSLIDSELFGHEKGAFTNAVSRKMGKVELATGGTLFLDEIGDMPLEAQVRLLRLLEERTFERVGGTETFPTDVRVVAATNRDLEKMVETREFREDLYYRLRVFPIRLPPLRERTEDVPDLAELFKDRMAGHLDKQMGPLGRDVLQALTKHHWPGNVRELEHTMQRAVIVCRGAEMTVSDLGLKSTPLLVSSGSEILPLAELERQYICQVLDRTNWHIKGAEGAAMLLGLPPSTLRSRMKKLGIKRPQ